MRQVAQLDLPIRCTTRVICSIAGKVHINIVIADLLQITRRCLQRRLCWWSICWGSAEAIACKKVVRLQVTKPVRPSQEPACQLIPSGHKHGLADLVEQLCATQAGTHQTFTYRSLTCHQSRTGLTFHPYQPSSNIKQGCVLASVLSHGQRFVASCHIFSNAVLS